MAAINRKTLSQAAAIRGQERNFTRNGESCKRLIDMLHNRDQKSKGEKLKFPAGKELSWGEKANRQANPLIHLYSKGAISVDNAVWRNHLVLLRHRDPGGG